MQKYVSIESFKNITLSLPYYVRRNMGMVVNIFEGLINFPFLHLAVQDFSTVDLE